MRVIGFSINSQMCQWPQTVTLPSTIKNISVSQLNTTTPDQKVNVTGTLSLGQKEPKEVLAKSKQEIAFVKEDCILEDSTGRTSIHMWSPLVSKLKNTYAYRLNNLTVKNFQETPSCLLHHSPLILNWRTPCHL